MTCESDLILFPGADYSGRCEVRDEAGGMDLTGYTASTYDLTGGLAGAVTLTLVDPSPAEARLDLTWQPGWALVGGVLGSFRGRFVNGGAEIGSYPVTVIVDGAADEIIVARGSDVSVGFQWPDDRDGADLSGDVIEVFNASPGLVGVVSVEVIDAATREVRWHIEGDPAMPLGDLGTFQMRRSTGGLHRRTTNLIRVICK